MDGASFLFRLYMTLLRYSSFVIFQMRKFVTPYSAGLRVRLSPSLQSEQVGIIKPNGIISYIYEVS